MGVLTAATEVESTGSQVKSLQQVFFSPTTAEREIFTELQEHVNGT